ncbi:DNA-binding transcriptional regulator of sugar metabolism, DeoR/GlpR family [Kosakonia arachidis]|uniref:DNA-binding transcriptional regulator of sugar metabolism, DeoR/GlpR family n=2 Tax=Kosakonia arachidis TaxID=551989 RepID=A0A1I7DV90_9ENTR|nr:DNA-binding transcriptional regulator of sugar metabolism, DeoR/GlpR family [Kosakonia arachidis]
MSIRKTVRQQNILSAISESPSLRIVDLARVHQVTTETIRRDLDELTQKGLLNRTYGGAVRAMNTEPTVTERHRLFTQEREHIARETVQQVGDGKMFMLGSGATTVHVARRMATDLRDITVITHSFGVATVLSMNPTIRVIVAPGDYIASEGAMAGAQTLSFLHQYSADYAILGASGVTADGPSEALIDCGMIYKTMIQRANKSIIVADHSKFDMVFPSHYASWQAIHRIITDKPPADHILTTLKKENVEISVCE